MSTQSEAMLNSRVVAPAIPRQISAWQKFSWSVKRELWENRSIYLAPLGAAALFLIGFLITSGRMPSAVHEVLTPLQRRHNVEQPFELAAALIMGVALLVSLFYSLEAMQGERRDRSILFWKSLPVSDLTVVLSKAVIPLFVIPLIAFAITIATQIIMIPISAAVLAARGVDVAQLWRQEQFVRSSLLLLYHLIMVHGLWWAPFYGWLLFASALTRRGSFVWAACWALVPPFAIGYLEYLIFNTSHFVHMLQNRFSGAGMDSITVPGTMPMNPMTQLTPGRFLASAGLWIGLAIFAAFIAGAAQLRRRRGPI